MKLKSKTYGRESGRLVAADWETLTEREREASLSLARWEGRQAAREWLGAPASAERRVAALRRSRWAREHGGLDGLDEATFLLYARAATLRGDHDYVIFVVERYAAEQAPSWWSLESGVRQSDPRVCAFCAGHERERRRVLGMRPLPTSIADLQVLLWDAKEAERESARAWMDAMVTADGNRTCGEQEEIARWEYRRCQRATDLAQMLLDMAIGVRLPSRRGRVRER